LLNFVDLFIFIKKKYFEIVNASLLSKQKER